MSSRGAGAGARGRRRAPAAARAQPHPEKQKRVKDHRQKFLSKPSDKPRAAAANNRFVGPADYELGLPELPVGEAKYMQLPLDEDALYAYDLINGVSGEAGALHGLHAEFDLGLRLNLLDPDAATLPPEGAKPPLDPLDAYICSPEFAKPVSRKGGKAAAALPGGAPGAAAAAGGAGAGSASSAAAAAAAAAGTDVEWMIRPNYMHLDLYDAVYKHADARQTEADAARKRTAALRARYAGPRANRIVDGFAAANEWAVQHPTKPNLKPARVWRVLPDADRCGIAYVHVSFDSDPTPAAAAAAGSSSSAADAGPAAKRARLLTGAVIRTAPEEQQQSTATTDGSVTVNFLVPAADGGAGAGAGGSGGAVTRLRHARDYHMLVERPRPAAAVGGKPTAGGDEQLALVWDDGNMTVTYAPIRTRASLTAAASAAGAAVVVPVHTRPLLPEEEDARDGLRADMDETDAQSRAAAKEAVMQRRLERQRRAAARAAAASSSSSSAAAAPART
jgi:hypothetical protein